MIRTCSECGGDMTVERSRADPHEPPVTLLVCGCGNREPLPADIEADLDNRPRMPGF